MTIRSQRGNMLALIAAVCLIVVMLLLFGLGYVRLLGSSSEQKTAIEAAALAAARDISKIVINTPEFGFIGLSDSAPNGSGTTAGDTFGTPVRSINTLIGTARLDYVIADALINNPTTPYSCPEMKELALADLTAAKIRADELIAVLDNAITPTGSATDKDSQPVNPYTSAEQAYTQNQIRMTGSSNYVDGSLQLTLGVLQGGAATNISIPQPEGTDGSLDASNTMLINGSRFYKSYTNVPFDGQDFVFAGIGDTVRLVDPKLWLPNFSDPTTYPYFHRTIIRAEANQNVEEKGTSQTYTMKAVACAQPASVRDPLPAPGALQISFPDGMPTGPEKISQLSDLYIYPTSDNASTTDYFICNDGDYPLDAGSNITLDSNPWPVPSDSLRLASTGCKIAIYDWLRRAGTRVNVTSVVGEHSRLFEAQGPDTPWAFAGDTPAGITHIFRVEDDGIVSYESRPMTPQPYYVISENQSYMESYEVIQDGIPLGPQFNGLDLSAAGLSATDGTIQFSGSYDLYVRLYSRRPGTTEGGKHAGEPLDNTVVATRPASIQLSDSQSSGTASIDNLVVSGRGAGGWMKGWKNKTSGGGKGKDKGANGVNPPNIWDGTEGLPPAIIGRVDFMQDAPGHIIDNDASFYERFDAVPPPVMRWTYRTNGTVSDIRFRRIVLLGNSTDAEVTETGYVGLK